MQKKPKQSKKASINKAPVKKSIGKKLLVGALSTVLVLGVGATATVGALSDGFQNMDAKTWFSESSSNSGNGTGGIQQEAVEQSVKVGDIVDGFYVNSELLNNYKYFLDFENIDENATIENEEGMNLTVLCSTVDLDVVQEAAAIFVAEESDAELERAADMMAGHICLLHGQYEEGAEFSVFVSDFFNEDWGFYFAAYGEDTKLEVFFEGLSDPSQKASFVDEAKALVYVNPDFDFTKFIASEKDFFEENLDLGYYTYSQMDGDYGSFFDHGDCWINTNVSAEDIALLPKIVIAGTRIDAITINQTTFTANMTSGIYSGILIENGKIYQIKNCSADAEATPTCIFDGSEWLVDDEFYEFNFCGANVDLYSDAELTAEQIEIFDKLIKVIY